MTPDAGILIVDDHEDTLYALESALSPLGFRLDRATSGDEALKQVLRGHVGLLLLDVRLPGVDGLDVVRYMRRVEQTQHIPVILLTGFGFSAELSATAFRLGVADLVLKPADPWTLRTKVRYLYDAHQRQLALEKELRELRARVRGHSENPARPGLPHPDALRLPRPDGARAGERPGDRSPDRSPGRFEDRDSLQKDRT
ncbi:response regulator [Streptomyces sp. CRN 30]|uniref:response regulator n=1 Tax=Streptomyces sp. CRN 30 TaxID=3075613 RepID=UPI002A816F5B|nr:response regulator [Streptomyces sp. CRN 30]